MTQKSLAQTYLSLLDQISILDPLDAAYEREQAKADAIWRQLDLEGRIYADPLTQVPKAVQEGYISVDGCVTSSEEHAHFDFVVRFLKGAYPNPIRVSTTYPWETLDVLRPDLYQAIAEVFGFTRSQKVEVFHQFLHSYSELNLTPNARG